MGAYMRFDGIIFDLDGTLWDSCATVAASWARTLSSRGVTAALPTAADVAGIMGLTVEEIADKIFSRYGGDAMELCTACTDEEPAYIAEHGGYIFPGVENMLEALSHGAKLFIVSNCQEGYIQSFLEYSGFGRYFAEFEYAGRTGLDKADNIRLVIQRNGLKAPVYIGDTALDEQSAAQSGCVFVHAAYGFGTADSPAAAAVSPSRLPEILESL